MISVTFPCQQLLPRVLTTPVIELRFPSACDTSRKKPLVSIVLSHPWGQNIYHTSHLQTPGNICKLRSSVRMLSSSFYIYIYTLLKNELVYGQHRHRLGKVKQKHIGTPPSPTTAASRLAYRQELRLAAYRKLILKAPFLREQKKHAAWC